jgi:hypothetical protein
MSIEQSSQRKYYTFNYPILVPGGKTLLTGIRGNSSNYYITGFYKYPNNDQQPVSFLYKGQLNGNGTWNILNYPSIDGQTVTSTNLYGPNILADDFVRIVGNYTINQESGAFGCIYEGLLDGYGIWITLNPPSEYPVLNTIAHSNMGNFVVGNYDTTLKLGKAFIYDVVTGVYYDIVKKGAISITAYGIWHNGGDSYTICGGFSDIHSGNIGAAYLVDWIKAPLLNNSTYKFSGWREYTYGCLPKRSFVTHFNGITSDGCGGYNLTGDQLSSHDNTKAGFFANVKRKSNGKLAKSAKWESISYPRAFITSGNSVDKDIVIGVYKSTESGQDIDGFISI